MKRVMAFGAATKQGNWPVQEDSYWIEPVWGTYVLGDGIGGKRAGEIASSSSVQTVGSELIKRLRKGEDADGIESQRRLSLEENHMRAALLNANSALLENNKKLEVGARAAVSMIAVQFLPSGRVILGNSGACGAVVLRGGQAIPLLSPQTFSVSQGNVSGTRSERFGRDFSLSGLGFFADLEPEVRTCHFQKGDYLLLFTEGFLQGNDAILRQAAMLLESGVMETNSLEEQAVELLGLSSEVQNWQKNASLILIDCSSRLHS